jgi:glutathione S-transferase
MSGAGREDPPVDRLRAAVRLISNHEAVARFAARGCGSEGKPPVTAPLSDPNAQAGTQYIPAVDAGRLALPLG